MTEEQAIAEMTTEKFLRSIDVHGILPQQEPFVMIDTLVHFEMNTSTTETTIRETNIFVDDGKFSASGMMENIAQTCAARIGYINKYILHQDVNIGFIGAVRNLEIIQRPKVGQTIETSIQVLSSSFGITLAHGQVRLPDGTLLAQGEMKIALSQKTV